MIYDPATDGEILVQFDEKPPTGCEYILTSGGGVFRSRDGGPWLRYYEIMLWSIPAHVEAIRRAPYQRIIQDNYTGPVTAPKPVSVVAPARARSAGDTSVGGREDAPKPERRKRVAKTKEAKKEKAPAAAAVPADKPQRLGARAKKLLEMDLGLTREQQTDVLAKADAASRKRVLPNGKPDTMTRVWDIYEAAEKELPAGIAKEREDFMKTGVLKRSGGGNGGTPKEQRGGKNADSVAPKAATSKQQPVAQKKQPADAGPHAEADSDDSPSSQTHGEQISGSSAEETETL